MPASLDDVEVPHFDRQYSWDGVTVVTWTALPEAYPNRVLSI
jgi:hypothetical protein